MIDNQSFYTMKKLLLSLITFTFSAVIYGQTTHQVCVSEVSGAACSNNNAVFTPANLTIAVGDNIQFTTYMIAVGGYNGNHQIRFGGGSPQDVVLAISTNIISPMTTVTTAAFNTAGVYSMECVNSNHCQFAQLLESWPCTGYTVTVGTSTEIEEEKMKQQVSVYPNPASNQLTVNLKPIMENAPNVYLMDVLGKTVKTYGNVTTSSVAMNVSELPKGAYFVKIVTDTDNYSYPVILQ